MMLERVCMATSVDGGKTANRSRLQSMSTQAPGSVEPSPRMSEFGMSSFPSPILTSTAEETDQVLLMELGGNEDPPESESSPSTPRRAPKPLSFTPPPVTRPKLAEMPPLLQALQKNSLEKVHAVLTECPESATEIFWDQACEPPLCAAVRLKCSAAIIKLLLAHGADAEAQNVRSRTPMELVKAMGKVHPKNAPTFEMPLMYGLRALTFEAVNIPTTINIPIMNTADTWRKEVCELLSAY